jgi:cytochrome b pre-mRNA-processing protein 3
MLSKLFGRPRWEDASYGLYGTILTQARRPEFYTNCGVADSVDGRFDLLTLHVFLVLHRLKREGEAATDLSQAVFDLMFADMDQALREMGASDMGLAPRVKKMVKAFYGRVAAYDAGLAGTAMLGDALARNLYRGEGVAEPALAAMVRYVQAEAAGLAAQGFDDLKKGRVRFGDPVTP